jgi:hypothetical protein
MKGLLSLTAVAAFASMSFAQSWMLKAPYEAEQVTAWNVTINTVIEGKERVARIKQVLTIDSKTDKGIKARAAWTNILIDSADQSPSDTQWDVSLNLDGSIASAGQSGDYGRMMTAGAFVYPNKEVKAFDTWTSKVRPGRGAKEMTLKYTVLDFTKVGGEEAVKVRGKLSETDGMTGDLLFWVARDGRVLKFDLDLTGWVIPFATESHRIDAKVKGELVKQVE